MRRAFTRKVCSQKQSPLLGLIERLTKNADPVYTREDLPVRIKLSNGIAQKANNDHGMIDLGFLQILERLNTVLFLLHVGRFCTQLARAPRPLPVVVQCGLTLQWI
jgi:hypothetical protein